MYKKSLVVISIFLTVIVCLIACGLFYLLQDLRYYSEYALRPIADKTGFRISFGDISWRFSMGLGVSVNNLKIIHAASHTTVLESSKNYIRLQLFPLLQKKIVISKIIFDAPRIMLIRDQNGSWPFDISSFKTASTGTAFSFMVNRCLIHDGTVTFEDRLRHTRLQLQKVNFEVGKHLLTKKFVYSFSAERESKECSTRVSSSGTISLSTGVSFPDNITGFGTLVMQKLNLSDYTPYVTHWFSGFIAEGIVDAHLEYAVTSSGLETDGWIRTEPLILHPPDKPSVHFKQFFYRGNALARNASVTLRNFELSLPGLSLRGTAAVNGLPHAPCINAQISTNPIAVQTIKQILPQRTVQPGTMDIFGNIADGAVAFKNLSLKTGFNTDHAMTLEALDGQGELHNVKIIITDTLPQCKLEHGAFKITKEQLTLSNIAAQWLPNDSHIINGVIRQPFDNAVVDARVTSTSSADVLADLVRSIFPDSASTIKQWFVPGTGIINITSQIQYPFTARHRAQLTAAVDLGNLNYTIGEYVRKPFGVPNVLTIKTAFAPGKFPEVIDCVYTLHENKLVLSGSCKNLKEPISAAYQFRDMDVSQMQLLFLPPKLQCSAVINGSGSITIPLVPFPVPNITGNLSVNGLTLQRTGDNLPRVTLNAEGTFHGNKLHVATASGSWGKSRLMCSGDFIYSTDPQAHFSADVAYLDLDDFIETVIIFKKMFTTNSNPAQPLVVPGPTEKTFFRRLVMNAPAHVHQGEFLSWRFAEGTTVISLKDGIMTYGDIKLQAYQGLITGSVVHDFSQPGIYRLTLQPTATGIEFEEFLPELKENNVITGKIDLTGSYTSQFQRDFEIVPHMEGWFKVFMKNATLGKFTVISKIFSLLNLSEMIKLRMPDVLSQGMPLDTVTGTFMMKNGVAHTENLFIKSPAMNLSAVGDIIFPRKEIDFIVGVQPLETIGKILGSIPIAGKILTGENKSITVSYFQVSGPYTEAAVKPIPVESLSRGVIAIFKRLYNLPQEILYPNSKKDNNPPHANLHTAPN
jgi:hypothetical protein